MELSKEQLNEFFRLLDVAGQIPSKIDSELAAGRAQDPAVNTNMHVVKAHDHTASLGLTLADLEKWGKALEGEVPPVVIPPAVPGKLTAGQAQQKLPLAANQIANWDATTDGEFSYAVTPSGDGQTFYYIGAENLSSTEDPRWLNGSKGNVPWKAVKAGQKVSAYYAGGVNNQVLFVDFYLPKQ